MASNQTNKLNSPFPDIELSIADPGTGKINRIWFELLLRLFNRTGGTQGGDLSALLAQIGAINKHLTEVDGEIADLQLLVESNPVGAMFVALLGRVAALEMLVASQAPGVPALRAASVLPEPVVPVVRPHTDDLRKLIEA